MDGNAGTTTAADTSDDTVDAGYAIGQCRGDQFVAASGLGSSPIICGTNAGQHSKFFDHMGFVWSLKCRII